MNNGYLSTTFALVGPPASGKGVCATIAQTLGCRVVGMGELLRKKIEEGDTLIKKYVDDGLYVPSKLVFPVLMENIPEEFHGLKLCFDGFPRTRHQAEKLIEAFKERKTRLVVLQMEVDLNVSRRRALERKRNDDKASIICQRITEHEKNAPALYGYLKRHSQAYYTLENNGRKEILATIALDILKKELRFSGHS